MMRTRQLGYLVPAGMLAAIGFGGCGSDDADTTSPPPSCTPTVETCNGLDDDCDAAFDEDANGNALTQPCTDDHGISGVQTCAMGAWGQCETSCTPAAEICNGVDDDCDTQIDEDAAGAPLSQPCTDGSGIAGTQTCASGAWGTCVTGCTPTTEVCNNQDDDCDGTTDEDDAGDPLSQDCSNNCGLGTEICVNGAWVQCTAPQPTAEVCNGQDDDCDNVPDNGFECPQGGQQNCGTDEGVCEFGTEICDNTCHWGTCLGGVTPITEVCEGTVDEDCDGTVDNGCGCTNGETQPCCDGSTIMCAGGTWPNCPPAPVETCNGLDDDCDGTPDDNLPVTPYLADEDITDLDDCDHAHTITTPVYEGLGAYEYDFHLYKADMSPDRDFFLFRADEDSDFSCITNPGDYECYTAHISLSSVPAGSSYEFCVYDIGFEGSPTTCGNAYQYICSTDEAPSDEVTIHWQGDCGFNDNRFFYAEVFPASGSELSCASYTLELELDDNSPQSSQCAF